MAASRVFSHLRRRRPRLLFPLSPPLNAGSPLRPRPRLQTPPVIFTHNPTFHIPPTSAMLHLSRSFSIGSLPPSARELGRVAESAPEYEHLDGGLGAASVAVGSADVCDNEFILPVRAIISLLDGVHDFTGLPWWIVISSSTLALRLLLFPVLLLQLKKLKRISEYFPKLPPPLPPPLSGRSYWDQISFFRKERQAIGCPSYLWFLASFSIQVPCFFLWMTSIRRMSLDHHPGFDCGGTLWFQNLAELPHGFLALIFPSLIAGLHYANVQISFRTTSVAKVTGLFGLLAKYYKVYLHLLTLPIFFIGFCVPQGSLVYWLTNSSLTVIQQLSLNNSTVRKKLGLPKKEDLVETANSKETSMPGAKSDDASIYPHKVSIQNNLSPQELLALSVKFLAKGEKDGAISLLRVALHKDPEYTRALVVMGQALLQKGLLTEATEYLERAISKLFLVGHPVEVDLLIVASQWAGVSCIRQGKNSEGIVHLQRVAHLNEPEEPKSKAHYFDGLLLLGSALYNEGRKAEAAKYLRMVASFNPSYKEYLEQCEKDDDTFVGDLVSSRRSDY